MTDYEKFLKGNISRPIGFFHIKFLSKKHEKDLSVSIFSYRISFYKNIYYLLIYAYKIKEIDASKFEKLFYNVAGTRLVPENNSKSLIYIINYNIIKNNDWISPYLKLLLKTKSLIRLNFWLKNKKQNILKRKNWEII